MLRFVLKRKALPADSIFAVANPTEDLLFTDAEVRGIEKHFAKSDILWYQEADKESVLKKTDSANTVHFSCHGSFQVASPLDSMLILAGGKSDMKKKSESERDIRQAETAEISNGYALCLRNRHGETEARG